MIIGILCGIFIAGLLIVAFKYDDNDYEYFNDDPYDNEKDENDDETR